MFRINNDMEGLQIVEAEMASPLPEPVLLPKSALTSVSLRHPNEVEMPNLECSDPGRSRGGFLHGVLSLDTTAPRNQGYMKSHVRVMKNFSPSDSYVRVCTSRHQAPFHEVKALLSLVELVPSYAFLDENDCEYPLFLRSAGLTLGLTYKVKCVDNPSESALDLYGLQGALIGATFEVQYPAKSILLHRKGKSAAERLRSAKVQMWTDSKELTSAPDGPGPATGSSNEGPTSPRHRAIPLDSSDEDVEATKIYLYSQHCIYVLFVSDRIVATKQPSAKKLISRTQPTTLSLTPNKLKGISSIRVRVIEGDSRSPAGIPIDHTKLRFAGQDTAAFAEFQSLQIEFPSSEGKQQCRPPQIYI
ncbi:hypothetical protein EJ04DRAFT_258081 [Polyplosphaeria fusca]|uniref:Uncharacterized protein n=1 Tax=Polyplosphaeria fusca TaxID=682080 RepID=A0A9P4V314_9PLEO|nr:hypothetical protein EJ04DRAFT_258081 [Polyplosphaeria fusca]